MQALFTLCMVILSYAEFFKITFSENYFRNAVRVPNSLDPDQVRRFVGPGLDPNCLQMLSADEYALIWHFDDIKSGQGQFFCDRKHADWLISLQSLYNVILFVLISRLGMSVTTQGGSGRQFVTGL